MLYGNAADTCDIAMLHSYAKCPEFVSTHLDRICLYQQTILTLYTYKIYSVSIENKIRKIMIKATK